MIADILINNGVIIDGTGRDRYRGSIAIRDGKIERIASCETAIHARKVIDANGQIIAPGFIDTHVHSDLMLLWDRQHASALTQGVTTEIMGQDGLSYAPLSRDNLAMYAKYLSGLNGCPRDIPLDWSSVYDYRMKFDGSAAVNTAYQVPHGPLRLETVGMKDVPLVGSDLARAKALLDQGLKEGAVAFSTGLSYYPCSYSDTDELVALCKTVADNNSVYVTHIRTVFYKKRVDPVKETIEIAERSGAKIHFSHFRTNPHNAGKVDELMRDIDDAYQRGVDLSLELYPYPYGSGTCVIYLPPWAVEDGFDATLSRLNDRNLRKSLIEGIEHNEIKCEGYFTHLQKNKQYIGLSFEAVAEERGQSVPDMLCDLLFEENLEVGYKNTPPFHHPEIWETMNKDFLELLSRPYYMVGSDGIPVGASPHPRLFGTFPRLLRFSREYGFRLEKMINRMTKVPAERFGLQGRGVIKEGNDADLVIFDEHTVTDKATFHQPRVASEGISYVLVNGQVALQSGNVTGIVAGKAISRSDES